MTLSEMNFRVECSGQRIVGKTVEKSLLRSCHVKESADPEHTLVLKGSTIKDCRHDGCFIRGVTFEDAFVEGLIGQGRLGSWLRGCMYSNVTVIGQVSGVEVRSDVSDDPKICAAYREYANNYYKSVNTSLDISRAIFSGLAIFEGVPPDSITRNSESQFIIHCERASEVASKAASLKTIAAVARRSQFGVLFVLDSSNERGKRQIDECYEMRSLGLVC